MGNIFLEMKCLYENKTFNNKDIYEILFDKDSRVDKRYLTNSIRKFQQLNKKMFEFLGIGIKITGNDQDLAIKFSSSDYIGVYPIKMPYDGIAHKDIVINPYYHSNSGMSDIIKLVNLLNYSIKIETSNELLVNQYQLRPPLYYEATKYIDLLIKLTDVNWVKFHTTRNINNYPKGNTDWPIYVIRSSLPYNRLKFESNDSVLTCNHEQWQELRYVLELAKNIIINSSLHQSLKYSYKIKIDFLERKLEQIKPKSTKFCKILESDLVIIKEAKHQANILLNKDSSIATAWRVSISELFERYVQYILSVVVKNISGKSYSNHKINSEGFIPSWGLKYLEPDILVKINDLYIIADVKYKANFYMLNKESNVLKEHHRSDLHQILAYLSFLPNSTDKLGILFYPADEVASKLISYKDSFTGIRNKIVIFGIPFEYYTIDNTINSVHEKLLELIEQ